MKRILLLTTFIFGALTGFSQIHPDISGTVPDQPSPNISKTAYLTNLTGKVMQAYPNPARDEVIIQHVSSADRAVISLINRDGKILQQHSVMPNTLQTQLRIGTLPRGIYIIRFDNARGDIRTLKLIKN